MVKSVEIIKDGKIMRGVMHVPDNKTGRVPCIIICHGFTGHKMEPHFVMVKISRMLEKMGIASLRFDFLGSGESDGEFCDMTLSNEIRECEEVLNFARKQEGIELTKIGVLGLSMGGAVALAVAARNPELISCSILLSPALNIYDIFINEIKGAKLETFIKEGLVDFEGNVLGKAAIDDAAEIDLYEYACHISGHTLIIHGTLDESVPPYISYKLKNIIGSKAELKWIEGADHCYCSREHEKELIDTIEDFAARYMSN